MFDGTKAALRDRIAELERQLDNRREREERLDSERSTLRAELKEARAEAAEAHDAHAATLNELGETQLKLIEAESEVKARKTLLDSIARLAQRSCKLAEVKVRDGSGGMHTLNKWQLSAWKHLQSCDWRLDSSVSLNLPRRPGDGATTLLLLYVLYRLRQHDPNDGSFTAAVVCPTLSQAATSRKEFVRLAGEGWGFGPLLAHTLSHPARPHVYFLGPDQTHRIEKLEVDVFVFDGFNNTMDVAAKWGGHRRKGVPFVVVPEATET